MGRRSLLLFALICALTIALVILAVFGYRWAGIVSEANRERMQTRLHTAVTDIQSEFNAEIGELGAVLNPALPNLPGKWHSYAQAFSYFRQKARYPDIVANVYALAFTSSGKRIVQWDSASKRFVPPSSTPGFLSPLARMLDRGSPFIFATHDAKSTQFIVMPVQNTLVLVRAAKLGEQRNFVVAELNLDIIKRNVLPDLIRGALGDLRSAKFQIGVLDGLHSGTVIYQSDVGLSAASFTGSDETVILWSEKRLISPAVQGEFAWVLVAKHREGSLAAVAAETRRRWLAMDFAVLIALALGLGTVVTLILRARALLRLQMEFVAGVSHELRTPLAVIGSAADNLAEGVVRSDKDVREYGSLIRSECRRLSSLVEQTLRFSANKADARPRDIQFVHITDVIDHALNAAMIGIESNNISLEKVVDSNLPMVRADHNLLSECLLNLISNALKYGGEAQWLGIRAYTVETGHGTGVEITVEDHGIGISSAELRHIFEPFYRGQTARSAQIRGTGLGLSLAREAANSIGARITATSTVGKGSAFTLHIPPAYMNSSTVPVEALVES